MHLASFVSVGCEIISGSSISERKNRGHKLIDFSTKCALFLQQMAAFKFKRARRVQAGGPGAGRNKAVAPNII